MPVLKCKKVWALSVLWCGSSSEPFPLDSQPFIKFFVCFTLKLESGTYPRKLQNHSGKFLSTQELLQESPVSLPPPSLGEINTRPRAELGSA